VKRIQLVNAGLNHVYMKSPRTGVYPPLNLASLAAFLQIAEPSPSIELLDGEMISREEICRRLDAEVVGISCNVMTYESALHIAEAAAGRGCRVVLGGPYPTIFAERILQRRPFVDAVIVGDGEAALKAYVEGRPYESIPNLSFRGRDGKMIQNPQEMMDLETLPFANYMNLPLESYFRSFVGRYQEFKPFDRSLAIYSRKGCVWRDASRGGCVFCMIPHSGSRYKSPVRLWEEIRFFAEQFGVNLFWEVSDTFTENSRWLEEFAALKPGNLDVSFNVYGRSPNITRRMASLLKNLGVYEVFLGVESGDDRILALSNKGITSKQSLRAVEHLAEAGINAVVSFVLGLPGETSVSLSKTKSLAQQLLMFGNVVETSCSIMLPIPGSPAFSMLSERHTLGLKHCADLLDLEELKHDWITHFTHVSSDELRCALRETTALFPLNDSFSQPLTESAPMC
jgi:anaerobic magnesium-protoporphyrin IX monomethyl ester cyclase